VAPLADDDKDACADVAPLADDDKDACADVAPLADDGACAEPTAFEPDKSAGGEMLLLMLLGASAVMPAAGADADEKVMPLHADGMDADEDAMFALLVDAGTDAGADADANVALVVANRSSWTSKSISCSCLASPIAASQFQTRSC
jgi:hypothetical protein